MSSAPTVASPFCRVRPSRRRRLRTSLPSPHRRLAPRTLTAPAPRSSD